MIKSLLFELLLVYNLWLLQSLSVNNHQFSIVVLAMSRKRKVLTLEERVGVIKMADTGKSCRGIALDMGVGKTQVQHIIKEREEIMRQWKDGDRSDKKYSKSRRPGYEDIDKVMWEWFTIARSKNIPVSGRMIQEKAQMYASELGHTEFCGSNGWLERWQKRHNVRLATLSGEAADVDPVVVDDWKKRLESICEGYDLRDIFNADETGLYYRALPSRSMVVRGDEAKGGKKSKERITVLLACSAVGEKLKPLVIGNSAKPRCFKKLPSLLCLPVTYASNKKAWMTSDIFKQWVEKINNKMITQRRSILLFVDNCSAHPDIVTSNVKLIFLPPNCTSRLQPCDAGIIQNVKMHYRKMLLRHVLFCMDEATCATDLSKKVNILDAILWLKSAWDDVQPMTIQKCFAKCGFTETSQPEEDDLDEVDDDLQAFADDLGTTWDEYVNFDDSLATNETAAEKDWEMRLLDCQASSSSDEELEIDIIEDDSTAIPIAKHVAIDYLNQLRDFALHHSQSELLELITNSKIAIEKSMYSKGTKQTKLTDFFSCNC